MVRFKKPNELFEDKIERVIKKYLPKDFKYLKEPELDFKNSKGKFIKKYPDFAISYANQIMVLIDAVKTERKYLHIASGSKSKQMREYSEKYVSIVVKNSNINYCRPRYPRILGAPPFYIMSITVLAKFLHFLSSRSRASLSYHAGIPLNLDFHRIIDKFIDNITVPHFKCKYCKNRLIDVDLYYCPDLEKYAIDLYMDTEQYDYNQPFEITFNEFDGCVSIEVTGRCKHFRSILAKQCRSCGAVFNNEKLLNLKDFDSYHADNLEKDFEFYKKYSCSTAHSGFGIFTFL